MEWFCKWSSSTEFCLNSSNWWWIREIVLQLWKNHRQWHRSFLKIVGTLSQVGDAALQKPNLPPRGVPNPNSGGARFTARLSDLYGSNNSSGHLWEKKIYHQVIKKKKESKEKWSQHENTIINKKFYYRYLKLKVLKQQQTLVNKIHKYRPSPHQETTDHGYVLIIHNFTKEKNGLIFSCSRKKKKKPLGSDQRLIISIIDYLQFYVTIYLPLLLRFC